MSTGTPSDPVCQNITAALVASPPGVRRATAVVNPVCRVFPTADPQTAVPPPPPAH